MGITSEYGLSRLCKIAMNSPAIAPAVLHSCMDLKRKFLVVHLSCNIQIANFLAKMDQLFIDIVEVICIVRDVLPNFFELSI